jgi:hypothetical protein
MHKVAGPREGMGFGGQGTASRTGPDASGRS